MSDKPKHHHALMWTLATALVARLRPACERIEIAGSLRRHCPRVGDIEIVAIPTPVCDLFGDPTGTTEVDILLRTWPITMVKNGPKYKQFTFSGSSGATYQVDLFLQPDPATWGVNYLLRTGSDVFAHKMVTPKWQGGYVPDGYRVQHARVWHNGAALETPEEEDVFRLWGMAYIAPEAREVKP